MDSDPNGHFVSTHADVLVRQPNSIRTGRPIFRHNIVPVKFLEPNHLAHRLWTVVASADRSANIGFRVPGSGRLGSEDPLHSQRIRTADHAQR